MYNLFWICVVISLSTFVTDLESINGRFKSSCSVSDLSLLCSSSKSVQFQWKLKSKWLGQCNNQILNVKYFQQGTNISLYSKANLHQKLLKFTDLQKDKRYRFNFVHYINIDNYLQQVQYGFKAREAATHEVAGVKSLKVENIGSASAMAVWSTETDEKNCISHFVLQWCWTYEGTEQCDSRSVANYSEQHTLEALTPCTTYLVTITAVDIDQVKSSKTLSQTFTTAYQDTVIHRDIKIRKVTPDSLSVSWTNHPCHPYSYVSISDLHKQTIQRHLSNKTSNTFTFSSLQPCTLYFISVSTQSRRGPDSSQLEPAGTWEVQAFTSVVSAATVNELRVSGVDESSLTLSWKPPTPWLMCLSGYEVLVSSTGNLTKTTNTTTTSLVVGDLEPCTNYMVNVNVILSGGSLSSGKVSLSTRTSPPARILSQSVENVSVVEQTANSLVVMWEPPRLVPHCLQGYNVLLYNSSHNLVYYKSNVPAELTSFTFNGLKQCQRYYICVDAVLGPGPAVPMQFFTETFTITADKVAVTDLLLEAGWNMLHIRWNPPLGYEVCTRHYEVRVCTGSKCESVTVNSTSYCLDNLHACTLYTAEVRTEHSYKLAAISAVTRGPGAVTSNQLRVVNETSDSITFRWEIAEDFKNCQGKFVISLWDVKGFVIKDKNLDRVTKEYKVQDLQSCHSYNFTLSLLDSAERPTINYTVVKGTTKASDEQKVQSLEARPNHGGMKLHWSVPPESTACVSEYQVSLKGRDGSLTIYNTLIPGFAWFRDPCSLDSAAVQIVSEHRLVGKPAVISLRQKLEDLSKLSVRVIRVGTRDASVQLVSTAFVCVSDFTISWYRVTNRSSTDSVANLTSLPNQIVTPNHLDPCTTYTVTVSLRNKLTEIGVLSTTLTTDYAEPVLTPRVKAVPRGFNISWTLNKHDTRFCQSHVTVTVQNQNFQREMKVFADSHNKSIEGLIPCQSYLISVVGFGQKKKFGQSYYSKWEKVIPEVLEVPAEITPVKVTNDSATLNWDVGTSNTNMCEPSDLKADCSPDVGLNMHIAGWSPVAIRLSRLKAHTRYNCQLVVINEAGRSNRTVVSFITSEGVPTQPKNIAVTARSSSEVLVTWKPPDNVPGVLTNYTVLVYNQTLTYPLSPACSPPSLGPRQLVVGGNMTQAVVGGLSPSVTFLVSVTAATAADSGPPSNPVASKTFDDVSDPVTDLNISVEQHKIMLFWKPPCRTNGPLDHFLVNFNGTRPNHNTAQYSCNVTVQQVVFKNYSIELNTSMLSAEAVYSATVIPIESSGLTGQNKSQSFTVPSRIPARASQEVFAMLPPVQSTRYTATVSIRSDLFPDTEGTIRYYAILVAGNFSYGPVTGWIHNQSWPKANNWAKAVLSQPVSYQATKPWWNTFEGMDTTPFAIKQYTLGTEECSKSDLVTFCNGPLKPGTSYSVRIRAFTSTGYRDSPSIYFQTVDPILEAYLLILALVVLAVATTIAFTYLSVRGHINWTKEKKGLVKSKCSIEEEKKSTIRESLPLDRFLNHIGNIISSGSLLDGEYKQLEVLTKQITGTTNTATLPINIKKNRYKNILPYDSNLVKLEGDEENSYFNASHIKIGGKKSQHYIACQGPKEENCEDFWRMIVQYKVNTIVMLCMPCEKGRIKCFPYFPISSGEVLPFGKFSVFCTREEISTNFIVRYLTVDKDDMKIRVQHFHYTKWPDHGEPEKPESLVEFLECIRKTTKEKQNIITVHCSAGVGRTGTFIVVDELLRKIRTSWRCSLSVADTVLQLRERRHPSMVQTEGQYLYIYKCLKYALENHRSFSERVRNWIMRRSKVELGAEEWFNLNTSSTLRQSINDSPQASQPSTAVRLPPNK